MNDHYTQEAQSRFFDLFDQAVEDIWNSIDELLKRPPKSDGSAAPAWKENLSRIVREYMMSRRFFLMRMFENDVTQEQAQALSGAEKKAFIQKLVKHAREQADYSDNDEQLILMAVEATPLAQSLFTRQHAFDLGHALRFSLADMQAFLLRTFEDAAGFRYNCSDDLIEAYVFLIGGSSRRAGALRQAYALKAQNVPKAESSGRVFSWTQDAGNSLPILTKQWSRDMDAPVDWHAYLDPACAEAAEDAQLDMRDYRFLEWLIQRAPHLDVPSQSATHIYRELAAFAYVFASYQKDPPDEDQFCACVNKLAAAREPSDAMRNLLYADGRISQSLCHEVAGVLLLENQRQSDSLQKDRSLAWHYLKEKKGKASPMGGIDAGRDRVEMLLMGEYHVEKADLLYLIWFIANMFWYAHPSSEQERASQLLNRLADFMEAAQSCLQEALLPDFYPPHLLEQSMMMSIIYSGVAQKDPAVVYEEMCASLIIPRKRK